MAKVQGPFTISTKDNGEELTGSYTVDDDLVTLTYGGRTEIGHIGTTAEDIALIMLLQMIKEDKEGGPKPLFTISER